MSAEDDVISTHNKWITAIYAGAFLAWAGVILAAWTDLSEKMTEHQRVVLGEIASLRQTAALTKNDLDHHMKKPAHDNHYLEHRYPYTDGNTPNDTLKEY